LVEIPPERDSSHPRRLTIFRTLNEAACALKLPSSVYEEGAGEESLFEIYKIIRISAKTLCRRKITCTHPQKNENKGELYKNENFRPFGRKFTFILP
jgi:hypothetical protein